MIHLIFALMLINISVAEEPKVEKSLLTNKELHALLGVTTLRVTFPKDYGNYYNLRLKLYKADKLAMTLGGRTRISDARSLALAIQDAEEGFKISRISSDGASPITIPKMDLEDLDGSGIYSISSTPVASKKNGMVVFERDYFQAEFDADGRSFSTDNPNNKQIGKLVVFFEPIKTQK
jgi:hypothetical protein